MSKTPPAVQEPMTSPKSSEKKCAVAKMGDSINQFSFKLLKAFASRHKDDSRNMCFSPLEVFNSLVMLLVGAKGASEAQLEDMLCLRNFNCKKKYDELIDLREFIIKSECVTSSGQQ